MNKNNKIKLIDETLAFIVNFILDFVFGFLSIGPSILNKFIYKNYHDKIIKYFIKNILICMVKDLYQEMSYKTSNSNKEFVETYVELVYTDKHTHNSRIFKKILFNDCIFRGEFIDPLYKKNFINTLIQGTEYLFKKYDVSIVLTINMVVSKLIYGKIFLHSGKEKTLFKDDHVIVKMRRFKTVFEGVKKETWYVDIKWVLEKNNIRQIETMTDVIFFIEDSFCKMSDKTEYFNIECVKTSIEISPYSKEKNINFKKILVSSCFEGNKTIGEIEDRKYIIEKSVYNTEKLYKGHDINVLLKIVLDVS